MGDAILKQAGTADLALAVERNLHALFRAMTALPGSELDDRGAVSRHFATPTNPMFKGAWATALAGNAADDAIDETIEWFGSRGAPYFFWWTGPATQPADLGSRLEARGLLSMESQQRVLAAGIHQTAAGAPAMAADLAMLDRGFLSRVPSGFAVEEVADDPGLLDFSRVFVETYGIPEWAGQAWVDATRTLGIGLTPWRMFLGRLDGEAVATNILFCGGGVASVYGVATLPKAQGRGIGAAITLAPLLLAHDAGYRYAVLFSTEMGVPVYRRIGFFETGGAINRYLWRAG